MYTYSTDQNHRKKNKHEGTGTWPLKLFPFYSVPAFNKPSRDLTHVS